MANNKYLINKYFKCY